MCMPRKYEGRSNIVMDFFTSKGEQQHWNYCMKAEQMHGCQMYLYLWDNFQLQYSQKFCIIIVTKHFFKA